MQRNCDRCGSAFEAKRERAKYCSSSCRAMAGKDRARAGAVVNLPSKHEAVTSSSIKAAVERQLRDAGKLGTYAGQQAVFLAGRLEGATVDTGSAIAALSKELDRLMAGLLADAGESDMLDEIQSNVVKMRRRA